MAAPLATLADVTRDHVLMVLEACGGRQTLAATVLKIDRKTIYRMLRRWGVDTRRPANGPGADEPTESPDAHHPDAHHPIAHQPRSSRAMSLG